MSNEVAAQLALAVGPLARRRCNVNLPPAERLGVGWQSRVQAETVQQPVGREAAHVPTVPFRRLQEGRRQEPHLSHGKWLDPGGDILAGEPDRILERQDAIHRALALLGRRHAGIGIRRGGGWLLGLECAGGHRGSGQPRGKRAATWGRLLVHGDTSPAWSWNRFQYATFGEAVRRTGRVLERFGDTTGTGN